MYQMFARYVLVISALFILPSVLAQTGDARVKRILFMAPSGSNGGSRIHEEYEYDQQGRILKVVRPLFTEKGREGIISYDTYEYDENGRLISVTTYNANPKSATGFNLLKQAEFTYSAEGLKLKESDEYPLAGLSEYSLFIYEKNRLVKTEKYGYEGQLESYILSDYDDAGNRVKETTFSSAGDSVSYTVHAYSDGLNIRSDVYVTHELGTDHLRTITRTYDSMKNLLTLESKELVVYSSMGGYLLKYEY